jgi:hypothetical protein
MGADFRTAAVGSRFAAQPLMPIRKRALVVGAAACAILGSELAVADDLPAMDFGRPVQCLRDGAGKVWRLQCDEAAKVCLYAPNQELDADGRFTRSLERARPCPLLGEAFDIAALEAKGFKVERAIADAPHGWMRDERGRVFQVSFDLKRRLYLGGSFAPRFQDGADRTSRSAIDFGLLIFEYYGGARRPTRHRLRLVEGEVFLAPFAADLVIAHYNLSRRYHHPLLRITTFLGKPRRSDFKLNVGVWVEGGRLEVHHAGTGYANLWRYATTHATADLWQSRDLTSFVRVRTGVGVEGMFVDGAANRAAVTPAAALETDLTLDARGFHHVGAEAVYERPYYYDGVGPERAERTRARLHYEMIFLAINDQPLSLRLAAGAERRDDLPGVPADWAFSAHAGLRFSLWAPPRSR